MYKTDIAKAKLELINKFGPNVIKTLQDLVINKDNCYIDLVREDDMTLSEFLSKNTEFLENLICKFTGNVKYAVESMFEFAGFYESIWKKYADEFDENDYCGIDLIDDILFRD